uniref:C2H2-type domain-containing protein n=1 Tax=Chromera velia CCMP2878 TaxID=1169474 RepID=A0A0G4F6Q6_9ALVE|eukprot:Cvel_15303.t1-p1 / transcript=Cvel_15303.t1 / gene=Cvel_15303 / organism=Chromera_velia_CCMP2878 / gene_product=tRNA 2-thiocytidine biosynthesis protein TtcA, putative / transcript_product=tRNA 2-thiocytidine biosynthesis protein TtcA, putative / location=Cvel_scaffold1123:42081-47995(-) / protein_length=1413 / sequence_SO=supercontig / SO=protein_coding / is_pseudo=false
MYRYNFEGESASRAAPSSTDPHTVPSTQVDSASSFDSLCEEKIAKDCLESPAIRTPFGTKPVTYADHTASGKFLSSVETFISKNVLPHYGNTHTLQNATARQSTFFRNEARQIAKNFLGATYDDALMFCGHGCTGAVSAFIQIMKKSGWRRPGQSGSSAACPNSPPAFLEVDRWGSYLCKLCNVRMKTEAQFRAHCTSASHLEEERGRGQKEVREGDQAGGGQKRKREVVFLCDPLAHHSLSLPFREIVLESEGKKDEGGEEVSFSFVSLEIDSSSHSLCISSLTKALKETKRRSDEQDELDVLPVALICATSNVTGISIDVSRVCDLVHSYGGMACVDFAARAAHIRPVVSPPNDVAGSVDVGFFSPHKFLGGPGSTGVLVMKKKWMQNAVPGCPGGGVVFFVSEDNHSYVKHPEEREEAGSPDLLACVRVGLALRLHSELSAERIAEREARMASFLVERWAEHPRIMILGGSGGYSAALGGGVSSLGCDTGVQGFMDRRAGIVSFLISYGNEEKEGGQSLYLHHSFVATLLNDLFGLQGRAGCACAGPYAQYLMGLSVEASARTEKALALTGAEVLRPGFTRVGVHFSQTWDEVEVIASAVEFVATHGWKFLPAYCFEFETGEWKHRLKGHEDGETRLWLSDFSLFSGRPGRPSLVQSSKEEDVVCPRKADDLIAAAEGNLRSLYSSGTLALSEEKCGVSAFPAEFSDLLWFALPADAAFSLLSAGWGKKESFLPGMSACEWLSGDGSDPKLSKRGAKFVSFLSPSTGELKEAVSGQRNPEHLKETRGETAVLEALARRPETPFFSPAALGSLEGEIRPEVKKKDGASDSVQTKKPSPEEDACRLHPTGDSSTNGRENETTGRNTEGETVQTKNDTTTEELEVPSAPSQSPAAGAENHSSSSQEREGESKGRGTGVCIVDGTAELSEMYARQKRKEKGREPNGRGVCRKEEREGMVGAEEEEKKHPPAQDVNGAPEQVIEKTANGSTKRVSRHLSSWPSAVTSPSRPVPKGVFIDTPKHLRRLVGEAVRDFEMIREGDRVLVGLSGGKDSLSMLHLLRDLSRRAPVRFEVAAATVDPQTPEYKPHSLMEYCKELGITYHFLSFPLIELAKHHMQRQSVCAFCSRMKRGILYSCMRKYGYTVLALGQHLDDLAESFVMSAFHNGTLNTMKAHYTVEEGDLRVCRPLALCRERQLAQFAEEVKLPVVPDNCPACFAAPKERHRVKMLLSQQEFENPNLFSSLLKALRPLISISDTDRGRQGERAARREKEGGASSSSRTKGRGGEETGKGKEKGSQSVKPRHEQMEADLIEDLMASSASLQPPPSSSAADSSSVHAAEEPRDSEDIAGDARSRAQVVQEEGRGLLSHEGEAGRAINGEGGADSEEGAGLLAPESDDFAAEMVLTACGVNGNCQ